MTYNFDPEKWYANHRRVLEREHAAGRLDDQAFDQALADLDRRHQEMLARLDGTFQIPG